MIKICTLKRILQGKIDIPARITATVFSLGKDKYFKIHPTSASQEILTNYKTSMILTFSSFDMFRCTGGGFVTCLGGKGGVLSMTVSFPQLCFILDPSVSDKADVDLTLLLGKDLPVKLHLERVFGSLQALSSVENLQLLDEEIDLL